MATKTKKTTSHKKSSTKVHDLAARKDPRGGAQRKEDPNMTMGTVRGGTPTRSSKNRLS